MRSAIVFLICVWFGPFVIAQTRPNILVIIADDLGYADVGFQGCKDIPTPALDRLASQSIRCTNGYVTHPFCSPTRAGLLTGRYQQHFGHENNPAWLPDSTVAGLPIEQTTLPQVLQQAGYRTGAVGKWHLGAHPQFHPNRRGFEHYYGLLGGGHNYLPDVKGGVEYTIPMNRNGVDEPLKGYLTDVLGEEAVAFIKQSPEKQSPEKPWFLYLAFNAPHTPLQVTEKQLRRVQHIEDEKRRNYAGLVVGLDDAVGHVLDALEQSQQRAKTMIWFFSDNGGPISVTNSRNTPLRGAKGQVLEGGVRVPFLVSYPGVLEQGKDYAAPVSSLDVFATSLAVAQVEKPPTLSLDGVNVLPYLQGKNSAAPHERLFWRAGGGVRYAVREGNWKLIKEQDKPFELYQLDEDISESNDLAKRNPDTVNRLQAAYEAWNQLNIAPLFESPQPARRPRQGNVQSK